MRQKFDVTDSITSMVNKLNTVNRLDGILKDIEYEDYALEYFFYTSFLVNEVSVTIRNLNETALTEEDAWEIGKRVLERIGYDDRGLVDKATSPGAWFPSGGGGQLHLETWVRDTMGLRITITVGPVNFKRAELHSKEVTINVPTVEIIDEHQMSLPYETTEVSE